MITGLLFTLAQRDAAGAQLGPANAPEAEGRAFPRTVEKPPRTGEGVMRVALVSATICAALGAALLAFGGVEWTFDPAIGFKVQTALINFTLPVGVRS